MDNSKQSGRGGRMNKRICWGCRVLRPHEHRCHKTVNQIYVCECEQCKEPTAEELEKFKKENGLDQ